MKQCVRCDREYADTAGKFCEMDGAYLISMDQVDELPPGVCPSCTGLSPGIAIDGETVVHCSVCGDTGKVTPEESERYWKAVKRPTLL
jgi:hypothetical protein